MDQRLEAIIRGMIRTERSRRTLPIANALRRVTDEFTTRGALGHGRYPVMLDREAATEYEWRADKWLNIVRRAVSEGDLSWTADRAREAQQLLESELATDSDELLELLQKRAVGGNNVHTDQLDQAKDRARADLTHELELLMFAQDRTRIPLAEQLLAPRYAAVAVAWKKSKAFLNAPTPDYRNAVKEALGAVEQLARIVIGNPTATLGDAVKELRKSARIEAPLLKGIEEIWGWSSGTPGVRHGAGTTPQRDAASARYAVTIAEAALGLLLANDAT